MIDVIGKNKVRVSAEGVAAFNKTWPCSKLRTTRAYWFEFDKEGDLIDTDVPEQDDGLAASAMAADCGYYLRTLTVPSWAL